MYIVDSSFPFLATKKVNNNWLYIFCLIIVSIEWKKKINATHLK